MSFPNVFSANSYLRQGALCVPLLKLEIRPHQPFAEDTLLFALSVLDVATDGECKLICPAGESEVIIEKVWDMMPGYVLFLRIPALPGFLIPANWQPLGAV